MRLRRQRRLVAQNPARRLYDGPVQANAEPGPELNACPWSGSTRTDRDAQADEVLAIARTELCVGHRIDGVEPSPVLAWTHRADPCRRRVHEPRRAPLVEAGENEWGRHHHR